MRCGLGKPHEEQQKEKSQVDSEFDPENPTRRNGPIPHSQPPALPFYIVLDTRSVTRDAGLSVGSARPRVRPEPMRVIAGQFRSRKLHSLPGMELRPTSDRLRETLFD